jgi:FAD/FMN-containing dehydrogenase
MPIPPDVARVLDTFRKLGDAARRALWLSERQAEREVREAAKRAEALSRSVRHRGAGHK